LTIATNLIQLYISVTKGIMDLHNGSISVASPGEGYGSTFEVEIPLYRKLAIIVDEQKRDDNSNHENSFMDESEDEEKEKMEEESSGPGCNQVSSPQGALVTPFFAALNTNLSTRILVVDDAPLNRKMIRNIMKSRGGVVDEASDGEEAVERVLASIRTSETYHMILMDNQMPRKSGPEAAEEIRAFGFKGLIIGVTGCAAAEEINFFIRHGADRVLQKPLDMDVLDGYLKG